MLKKEIIQQPDAVEKYFCEPFSKLQQHEMPEDTMLMYMNITLSGKIEFSEVKNFEALKKSPMVFKMMEKALKYRFTFKITDYRLIIIIAYAAGSQGNAIMYLTYLQYWCKKHNKQELTFEDFGMKIFPMGFPSEKDLTALWDKCKVDNDSFGSDNLLDYQTALKRHYC